MQVKAPKTIDEQIWILQEEHNLRIDNPDYARQVLSNNNYYRLSAYGIGLRQPKNPERYVSETRIEKIVGIYEFDKKLRALFYLPLEFIEVQLKTRISYYHASKYGALGYEEKSNFNYLERNGEHIHESILSELKKEIERQKEKPVVKHHRQKYGGKFPLWVAVDFLPFGAITKFYSIMLNEERKDIANLYGCKNARTLNGWMQSIREIRNICAHFNRLYNMPLQQEPKLYKEHSMYKGYKLFPVILVLKKLLSGTPEWEHFSIGLVELVDEYKDIINLDDLGFPAEWCKVLKSNN